jgi:hypothetical protein
MRWRIGRIAWYVTRALTGGVALLTPGSTQANNASQLRADDYSIIGASLSALLIPAIFLRRAPTPALVLGGASIGLGVGTWTHVVKMFTEGEKVKPEGMVRARLHCF